MEYEDAVEYLNNFANYEKDRSFDYPEDLKLDRMIALARELGNPQKAYESVIIAGSKGKGSTAAFLASIFKMENYRTGLYTSPHLVDLSERIQVNGLHIGPARFAAIMDRLKKILDDYAWRKEPPTYFEILTALAFYHFKEQKVHIAVLEVGLGGLYDSTNVAPAKVVGLTPISLEHTDKLGRTLSKIAVQKCGIIKGREHVVSGQQKPEVEEVIRQQASSREAQVSFLGKEIHILERECGENFQRFDVRSNVFGNFYDLKIGLRGAYQIENAAVALGMARALEGRTRLKFSEKALRRGFEDARWPGRLEKVSDRPKVILDAAHTVESMRKMLVSLKRHFSFSELVTVFAVSSDKDAAGMLEELLEESSCVVVTKFNSQRAAAPRELAETARSLTSKEIFVVEDSWLAVRKAVALAAPGDLVLITGSLFLVGEVKSRWLREGGV